MAQDEKKLIIGSRESLLAVRQSEIVLDYLCEHFPQMQIELVTMKTTGDKILHKRLDEIGGKGLFVKELDQALRDGRTDLSVHSLKDLPAEIPEDLPVIGFSVREDPRDVLVLPEGISDISEMDFSKPIGTSSRRRTLQAQELFPQAGFESVRGNVLTRLRKLDEGQYSAIILAAAGLRRLGLENRISRYFSTEEMIPSAGQGILALQGRKGVDYSCLDGFVSALGGGCTSPISAHAEFDGVEVDRPDESCKSGESGASGVSCGFGSDGLAAGIGTDTVSPMTLSGFYYDEENRRIYRKKIMVKAATPEEGRAAGRELAALIMTDMKTHR